jgi:four helix bundle protein
MSKSNIIVEKSFEFGILIIGLYQKLKGKNEFDIARQILRSGTSIGANIQEATAGVSKADFVNKMAIASKEARETKYWLLLLKETKLIEDDLTDYLSKVEELNLILTSIVKTTQEKKNI